jgi:hypothetical protein
MNRSKSFVTKEEAAQVKATRVETAATILGLAQNKIQPTEARQGVVRGCQSGWWKTG